MADFSIPFSTTGGDNRYPTSDEKANGFDCGPADKQLFNGLFRAIQAEIGTVITYGGVSHTDTDDTLLRQAITNMIDAATGGSGDFVLMAQARARLPIYPEVTSTTNNTITLTSTGAGNVRIPAGETFLHRGIYEITTSETDLVTSASKTYHVRWDPTNGYDIYDLANGTYNPSSLAEDDVSFDSTLDDMLLARVVTNGSNSPTITSLANANQLVYNNVSLGTDGFLSGQNASSFKFSETYNWARVPEFKSIMLVNAGNSGNRTDSDVSLHDYAVTLSQWNAGTYLYIFEYPVNRYRSQFRMMRDYCTSIRLEFNFLA